jgi:hypothetical protein
MNLSKGLLPSPSEDGWGRTQPIGRGVEYIDHGKAGTVGKTNEGVIRIRRPVPRRSV